MIDTARLDVPAGLCCFRAAIIMDWNSVLYLLLAILLVLLNGFFVLAEFALVKVRATRIEELARTGQRRAQVAKEMVTKLDAYLTATQLGITIASLALGWVGEPAFESLFSGLFDGLGLSQRTTHTVSLVVSFLVITFLHILFGEQVPKIFAIKNAEASTLMVAYPMLWSYRLFYLPMLALNGACTLILKLFGLSAGSHEMAHTEQEMRMLLAHVEIDQDFSMSRLFMLENIFDLGRQTVRDAMIPWNHVISLSRSNSRYEVMRVLTEHKFSRYPVLNPATYQLDAYLLMKDLVVHQGEDWQRVLRPLRVVRPTDSLEPTMHMLQQDGANMAVVMDQDKPIGLITLEDILEEVVGRIEDEYPRLPRCFLKDALESGAVVLDVEADSVEGVISALATALPRKWLPAEADIAALAMERERLLSTDVGHGVAIPHARCPGAIKPLMVFGRLSEGVSFGPESTTPARLVFLLVTPAERPNLQVFFLSQVAQVVGSELVRERLCRAQTPEEVIEIIAAADPAVTG